MLNRSVIPKRHHVFLPMNSELVFGNMHLAVKHIQQGITLIQLHTLNGERKLWTDVEGFFTSHRMNADDRMDRIGKHIDHFAEARPVFEAIAIKSLKVFEIIHSFQTRNKRLGLTAEPFESSRHA